MLHLSSLSRSAVRTLVLVPAFALVAVACSSGDEAVSDIAADVEVATEQSGDTDTDTDTDTGSNVEGDAPDCEALLEARVSLQGRGQTLASMEDVDLIAETYPPAVLDEMDALIEVLRPYQDVEGVLGAPREGLDRLAADITAVREGRLDDRVGDHGYGTLNGMLAEIC